MPPPQTPRLRFRDMSRTDLDDMAGLLGDPTIMKYYPHPKTRAEAERWIEWNRQNYAEFGHGLWLLETHQGEFIGDCGLTWQTLSNGTHLEIGYHVKLAAQRLGYATEAAGACRDFARSHTLATSIVSIIHEDNRASQRVAEKIGMSSEGTLHHSSLVHNVLSMDL